MQQNKHPKSQVVLFVDSITGSKFLCNSTLNPKGTEKFEGKDYPVYYLSISSASHPLYTGSRQLVDSEGRVERFRKRFGSSKEVPPATPMQAETNQADSTPAVSKPKAASAPAKKSAPAKAPAKSAKK